VAIDWDKYLKGNNHIHFSLKISCKRVFVPDSHSYSHHETFGFDIIPAVSLGGRLYVSRKSGTGRGWWVHPKAWLHLDSSLEMMLCGPPPMHNWA